MQYHLYAIEEQARIRLAELHHDRARFEGPQDLGILAAIAAAAGAVRRCAATIEAWAQRPATPPPSAPGGQMWPNS